LPTAPVVLHVSAVIACHLHFRTDAESSTSHSPFVSACNGTITCNREKSSAKALQQADTTRELRAGNS